jgi:hypothetical protein
MSIVGSGASPGSIVDFRTSDHFSQIFDPNKAIGISIESMPIDMAVIGKAISECDNILEILGISANRAGKNENKKKCLG